MKKNALFLFVVITGLISCKKTTVIAEPDKQVILDFPIQGWSTINKIFDTLPQYSYLSDFDKRDYQKVDSITFNVSLSTESLSDTVTVRLFNLTDGVEIANSSLTGSTTSSIVYKSLQTNNIFNSLPDKRITLAVQMKRTAGKSYVYLAAPYLKLRRP